MPTPHHPRFTITSRQLTPVGKICERIGRGGVRNVAAFPTTSEGEPDSVD